jgi:hypothetical protein
VKIIDPVPFFAVSTLFHETRAIRPPRLPEDVVQLLELALLQHESFRGMNLDPPPTERLKGAAVLQFYILAALNDLHARPLFHAPHDPGVSTALLYAEMIRRLLTATRRDQPLAGRPGRFYLQPLAVNFHPLTQPFHEELSDAPALAVVHQHCADYLNHLAFALYQLENPPMTA